MPDREPDAPLDADADADADAESLFVPVAGEAALETWLPTDLSRGPWDPGALHGGPVGALLARAVERVAPAASGHVSRFTMELLRPVPVAPLTLAAAVTRPGRKVQMIEAELAAGDTAVARCRALWLRVSPAPLPGGGAWDGLDLGASPERPPFPGPEESVRRAFAGPYRGFHNAGAELRFARGGIEQPGPAAVWIRLAVPVVPGEGPSPLQRAVAAADFGNGVSAVLPMEGYTFVNPDLTVASWRRAAGEWVALEAATSLGVPGVAMAQSVLWDERGAGPFGRGVQCLVVEPR